jgi:hypothetical protein
MQIEISIPMKAYLKRYVEHTEKLQKDHPLILTETSHIGAIIAMALTNKRNLYSDPETHINNDFNDQLKVKVNIRKVNDGAIHLSESNIHRINTVIYKQFQSNLAERVKVGTDYGKQIKDIIRQYMVDLGIEEMISEDAIIKAQYRLRKT